MAFAKLKRIVMILLVGSHLATFILLFSLYVGGGYAFDEFTTAVALLMPLFAGYTTIIVKDVIAEASTDGNAAVPGPLPWNFSFLTLAFIVGFSTYLLLIVTLKGYNIGFTSFEQFKGLIGVSESVFGVYIGTLLPTLFRRAL